MFLLMNWKESTSEILSFVVLFASAAFCHPACWLSHCFSITRPAGLRWSAKLSSCVKRALHTHRTKCSGSVHSLSLRLNCLLRATFKVSLLLWGSWTLCSRAAEQRLFNTSRGKINDKTSHRKQTAGEIMAHCITSNNNSNVLINVN